MKKQFTPLNKVADEIGGNKLVAVGGLKPPTSDTYLTGFTIFLILVFILGLIPINFTNEDIIYP